MSFSSISPSRPLTTPLASEALNEQATSSGISIAPRADGLQELLRRADSFTKIEQWLQEHRSHATEHTIVDSSKPTTSPQEAIAAARAALERNDTYTLSLPENSSWSNAARGMVSYEPQVKSSISSALQGIQAQQSQEVVRLKKAATTAIATYEKLILTASKHANEAVPTRSLLAIEQDTLKISPAKEAMEKAVTAFKHAQTPAHYVELLNEAVTGLVCNPAIEFFEKRATPEGIASLSADDKIPLAIGTVANPHLVLDDSNAESLEAGAIQTAIELRTAHMLASVAVHVAKEHLTDDSASATRAHATLDEINNLLDSHTIQKTIFQRAGVSHSSATKDEERASALVSTPVKARSWSSSAGAGSSETSTTPTHPRTHVPL